VARCRNISVTLNASGTASVSATDIDNGSSDNIGITSRTLSRTSFTCADVGTQSVTLTVADAAGNTASCAATVTVNRSSACDTTDTTRPSAICRSITVTLNAAGTATIEPADLDAGSTDNVGITSRTLSRTNFTCADVGNRPVTLTVGDAAGNTSSCTAAVTVVGSAACNPADTTPPSVVCRNATILIGASGTVTLSPETIEGGSSDNVGVVSRTLSTTEFTCASTGLQLVTLTVADAAGNTASCTATVTVEDSAPPLAVCRDVTVTLDNSGTAFLSVADVDNGSSDNCGIVSRMLSRTVFSCADLGSNTVTLSVADRGGLVATCEATVTVVGSGACEEAQGTGALTGVVFDPRTGTPLTCATVVLSGPANAAATTNARGEYYADNLPGGTYTITVFVPGAEVPSGSVTLGEGATLTRNLSIETGAVSGLAIDGEVSQEGTGVPLGGVRVDAFAGQNRVATTYTCASGRYGFSFAALGMKQGEVTLLFSAVSYESEERTVVIRPGGVTVNVDLAPKTALDSGLAGQVTSAGVPVAGVTVKARPLGGTESKVSTAPDGRFLFGQLPAGPYSVEASNPGYVTQRANINLIAGSAYDWAVNLPLDEQTVPTTESEFRTWLGNNFNTADSNGDGMLTYDEVIAVLPTLPQPIFENVDADSDTQVSRVEAGVGGGGGICCTGGGKSARELLGDWLLIGLMLSSLLAMRAAMAHKT
jgi:hypothetical protein